jgi:DNA-binding transcriptional MerR regulator
MARIFERKEEKSYVAYFSKRVDLPKGTTLDWFRGERAKPACFFFHSEKKGEDAMLKKISLYLIIMVAIAGLLSTVMKVNELERLVHNQDQTIQKQGQTIQEQGQTIQQLKNALGEPSSATTETINERLQQVETEMEKLTQKQATLQQTFEEVSNPVGRPAKLPPNTSPALRLIAETLPPLPADCREYDDSERVVWGQVPIVKIGYFKDPTKKISLIHVSNNEVTFLYPPFSSQWWWEGMQNAGYAAWMCNGEWEAYFFAKEILNRLSYADYYLQASLPPLEPKGKLIIKGTLVVPHSDEHMKWRKLLGQEGEIIEEATREVEP